MIEPNDRSIYLGCSGRSLHARLDDHIDDIKGGLNKNAMVKHFENKHQGYPWQLQVPIRVRAIRYHTSLLHRVIDESLRLEKNIGLANSKGEWGRGGGLVRNHSRRTNDG